MKKILKWLDDDFEEFLLMLLLLAISIIMMTQICCRTFGKSLTWAEEFSRFCFVYTGFLSIGYCIRREKMLKVDILVGLFPKPLQVGLDFIGRVLSLIFFAYMSVGAWGTYQNSIAMKMTSAAMRIPMATLYFAAFAGFALGTVRQVEDLIRFINKHFIKKDGSKVPENTENGGNV